MRIGELASKAGVNIQTIRFYERKRVLPPPHRSSSGYRSYAQQDLVSLRFIRQSQALGFTLAEIRDLLGLHAAVAGNGSNVIKLLRRNALAKTAHAKIVEIDEKVKFLRVVRSQLSSLMKSIETQESCPVSSNSSSPGKAARTSPRP